MAKNETILALDPGLRELGFAVMTGPKVVASGVRPLYLTPSRFRVGEARRTLLQLLKAHRPQLVILERTNTHPTGTFNSVHLLARSLLRMCIRRGIRTATYATQTVRKAITGNGNAPKREVAKILAARFPSLHVYVTQDKKWKERFWQNLFDALALAVFHQMKDKPPSRSRSSG